MSAAKPIARRAACAFPFILWLIATMFLRGDLGRWNDDYEFNQRIPETGVYHRLTEPMEGQVWRPLFFTVVPALQTLLWDHARINHAIQAGAHGLATLLLFLTLRALGISRPVRAALSILFLTCPITFQALFWSASLPTILSASLFMGVTILYTGWVHLRGGMFYPFGMVVLGMLIPLLNEQPAPALAALPVLWLGTRPRLVPTRIAAFRCLWPLVIIGAACAAYLMAYFQTTPPGYPGSRATLVHLPQLGPRLLLCLRHAAECLAMGGHWTWFLREGLSTITAAGVWGWLCIALLALTGAAWITRSAPEPPAQPAAPAPTFTRASVALFGLAAFALSWAPILAIATYEPASRLFYSPFVGLAIAIGVLADRLRARIPTTRAALVLARTAVALLAAAGTAALVGAQRAFRDQDATDSSYAAQLRALVPRPLASTFFVPVRIDDPACRVAPTWLDLNFHSILLSSYNVRMWIKYALARSDVFCGTYSPDHGAYPLADPRGLGYGWKFVDWWIPESPGGVWTVPWPIVVPFEIDAAGTVHVASRIVLERADNADLTFEQTQGATTPGLTAAWYDRAADAAVHPLGSWTMSDGRAVAFQRARQWTSVHTAARIESPLQPGVSTTLPATPAIASLYFRATLGEDEITAPAHSGVACRVTWTVEGDGAPPPFHLDLSADSVAADQRWTPVTLTLPPHPAAPWLLRVAVEPLGARPVARPWVTAGLWSDRLP